MTQTSTAPSLARFPAWLLLCAALTALAPLSIDMYLPSFPSIGRSLHATPGAVELTLGAYLIGLAIGQAFYGPLSDRFGRKPPLYVGLTIYAAASVGCALATSVEMLTALRLLQALGGCAGLVIARASVRDRLDARGSAQAFSSLMLVMGVAPILAPLLGGLILQLAGWRAIFGLLFIVGVALLAAVHFQMEETVDAARTPPLRIMHVLRSYGELFRSREFLGYSLCGGFVQAGMFAYIAGSPFVLIELYQIPAQYYGLVFGTNALGLIAASQLNGRLIRRHTPQTLLHRALWVPVGFSLVSAATVWLGHFLHFGTLPVLLLGFFGYLASIGCISPNTAAVAMTHQGHRAGTAAALMGALQFGLGTLSGVAVGLWSNGSAIPLVSVMAICALLGLALGAFGRRADR